MIVQSYYGSLLKSAEGNHVYFKVMIGVTKLYQIGVKWTYVGQILLITPPTAGDIRNNVEH
ncbi:MAG: hypothetical protein QNK51_03955 [Chitinophagales bacterium]